MDKKTSSNIDEGLMCAVCLERLDVNNKVLPCQHTFHKTCLDGVVTSGNELRCPECRTYIQAAVKDLPSNIALNRLLDNLNDLSVTSAIAGAVGTTYHGVKWQYTEGTAFKDYPEHINKLIEHRHNNGKPNVTWKEQQSDKRCIQFTIDFKRMVEMSKGPKCESKVHRVAGTVKWQYQNGVLFKDYPQAISTLIEKKYSDGKTKVAWKEEEVDKEVRYAIDFKRMVEIRGASNIETYVHRYVSKVEWQYNDNDILKNYPEWITELIEKQYSEGMVKVSWKEEENTHHIKYEIDFKQMIQTEFNGTIKVRRLTIPE